MYRELPFDLDGAVVWTRHVLAARVARIVPDGCLDIIWTDGSLIVAGPDTRAHVASSRAGASYVGVRFAPGQGPPLLGVPADELRDARPRLDALWPVADVRTLAERLAQAADPAPVLAAAVRDRLRRSRPDPLAREVARRLGRGHSVGDTANAVDLSPRHLHRRCLTAFGYGPKTLAMVLRFRRALALARSGRPFAEVAATSGYADQAHLARDVRALAGVPLRHLLSTP